MSLVSGAIVLPIFSAATVWLLWHVCPPRIRKPWILFPLSVIVPFTVAYCTYFFPVWFEHGSSSEYHLWAVLVIVPWVAAGVISSAAMSLAIYLIFRKNRMESMEGEDRP